MPYMKMPGEDRVVAARLHAVPADPPRRVEPVAAAAAPPLAGQRYSETCFVCRAAAHMTRSRGA